MDSTPSDIPDSLAPFFQEYNLAQLDLVSAASTIIERTLRFGNRLELRWLFQRYPKAQITAWVQQWGRSALPPAHLAF